jgi:hypothetical protein
MSNGSSRDEQNLRVNDSPFPKLKSKGCAQLFSLARLSTSLTAGLQNLYGVFGWHPELK